jgi:regulator of protease activity HflC (stomatin/prohibitin superfamily)
MSHSRKTTLIQKSIGSVSDALRQFETTNEVVPIVLVPSKRLSCSCFMTVPTGPHCILHRFGKDVYPNELAATGFQCTPSCNEIAYCITAKAITYEAPVKSCPTADNVMVDCFLSIIFNIGPSAEDVKKFAYRLGAYRFDEFLYAALEEGIRHLIRSTLHTAVYELKGSGDAGVEATRAELNRKFNRFGVKFSTVAITDVKFKDELQRTLQEKTEFDSKIKEEAKKQKNAMDQIEFEKTRRMQVLTQTNARKIQDLQAKRTRIEIDREKDEVDAKGRAEVEVTKANTAASVHLLKAKSELDVSKKAGQKQKEERIADATAADRATRIRVEQECKNKIFAAEQQLAVAKAKAAAIVAEAEAESLAAASLKLKREHDLRMAKAEVLQTMARSNRMVIGGTQGDALITEIMDKGICGDIKLG